MSKRLVLALAASSVLFATPAFAIHNGWASPPPTQGGSTNDCNTNPGCTTTSQPKGQVDQTKTNSSPKTCTGPAGQCK
jgi:hypothetical protein